MARRIALACFFFLLFAPVTLATACTTDAQCAAASTTDTKCSCDICVNPRIWYQPQNACVESSWKDWGPVSMLAAFIAFLVAILAYMLGIGFGLSDLKAWAKSEMYQALASTVMVVALIALSAIILDRASTMFFGPGINPFSLSRAYLNDLNNQLLLLYGQLYGWNFPLALFDSLAFYTNLVSGTDQYVFAGLLKAPISIIHVTANYNIMQAFILIGTWRALLDFAQATAFTAFLPLGVFLRIFPITRGAGGLLIALAIGLFFVFPSMLALIALMTDDQHALADELSKTPDDHGMTQDFLKNFNACDQNLESIMEQGSSLTDPAVSAQLSAYASFLPAIMLKLFFYPIVVMAATVTFIRVAAPLLGSDVTELGEGLVRLL